MHTEDTIKVSPETVYEQVCEDAVSYRCVVVAENWPSWLSVVLAMKFEPVRIYSSFVKRDQQFFSYNLYKIWKPIKHMSLKLLNKLDVVFISGSIAFIADLNKVLSINTKVVVIEGPQPNRRTLKRCEGLSWERVKHTACGGVTDLQFWFGWSGQRDLGVSDTVPRRFLIDVLSPTASAYQRETAPLPDLYARYNSVIYVESDVISSLGIMTGTHVNIKIKCPSVFTKTKWCIRKLSTREVSECFDQTSHIIEKCVTEKMSLSKLPFVQGIPNKVLQYITRRLNLSNIRRADPLEHQKLNPLEVIMVPPTIEDKHLKAVKADDALVDTYIWDERVIKIFKHINYNEKVVANLNVLRRFFLGLWQRRVCRSFQHYLITEYGRDWKTSKSKLDDHSELRKDIIRYSDCVFRAKRATWFEWNEGSTIFFWRWAKPFRRMARDGIPYWFRGKRPKAKKAQSYENNDEVRNRVREKLNSVRSKGYIKPGFVKSLIRYFSVPKGDDDVRMVYDGTSSGFNDWVWAPSFSLPTIESMLRSVDHQTWLGDLDVAEQFLNFQLCEEAQIYCGVDLTPYFDADLKDGQTKIWERWTRCLMGAKPSPYQAIRFMLWAEHIVRGDRFDSSNPFRWSYIKLNMPGSNDYDPSVPWLAKVRSDGCLASEFYIYVDDVRITGPSEDEIWKAIRRFSSIISYLGIQDAARKRRPPTTRPGAWAGSMVYVDSKHVGVYIDQTKWTKTKEHIRWIKDQIMACDRIIETKLPHNYGIDRKELERRRGFLVYVSRTYPAMTPYLKGIHQTLDGWREGRDEDGWRVTISEMKAIKEYQRELNYLTPSSAPKTVFPCTHLEDDILCLENLFKSDFPVVRHVRSKQILLTYYGFGDASGSGFGSTFEGKGGLRIRYGLWGRDSNKLSSNYRELCNLVDALESEVINRTILGSEVFVFTDNAVAEACFYKGTSQSRALFNLVLRLRKIEIEGGLRLQLIHVAGKRMIAQGTDGLSRGNLLEGVMAGERMLNFVPLHLTALERSPNLLQWLESWAPNKTLQTLKPEDWYTLGHGVCKGYTNQEGIWIPEYSDECKLWTPAPSVAFYAMEELSRSRHVNPYAAHVFVCPRLMTFGWRKMLLKYADVVFYINAGSRHFWSNDMYEPLVIALILPFSRKPPWQLKRSPQILALEEELRRVWLDEERDERSILCQFWSV